MVVLVTGAASSGKSAYAEDLVMQTTAGERIYLATMESTSQAAKERIAHHRRLRAGKSFLTIERGTCLEGLALPERKDRVILLECVSNLVANEMFGPPGACPEDGDEAGGGVLKVADRIFSEIASLKEKAQDLVIVTNEVFGDGCEYPSLTRDYIRLLGEVNVRLAAWADRVILVVCGIGVPLKKGVSRDG